VQLTGLMTGLLAHPKLQEAITSILTNDQSTAGDVMEVRCRRRPAARLRVRQLSRLLVPPFSGAGQIYNAYQGENGTPPPSVEYLRNEKLLRTGARL